MSDTVSDTIATGLGFILGVLVATVICFITSASREEQMWVKPAAEHGFGRYVVDSPTSKSTHWEWVTNRTDGGAK